MNIQQFFLSSQKEQAVLFHQFKKEVKSIVKKCLWVHFNRVNDLLIEECTSFIFEKLAIHHAEIENGKERSFIYTIAKRYFQEWFYTKKRNANTIFIEDLLSDDQNEDTIKYLKYDGRDHEAELEELRTDTVLKFNQLLKSIEDRNALLVINALIECILTQENYNSQFLSLYLFRRTNLRYDSVFRLLKNLNLKFPLSRPEYFDKVFNDYQAIESIDHDDNEIISAWEKRGIFHYENHHDRFKSPNFEERHNRNQQKLKVKSAPKERTEWIRLNPNNKNLEQDYYKKFGMSYRTFKNDKRMAYN